MSSQRRFLLPKDVAEELKVSVAQVTALLRAADLAGIKIGGRGKWRVGSAWEDYIKRGYDQTRELIREHPVIDGDDLPAE